MHTVRHHPELLSGAGSIAVVSTFRSLGGGDLGWKELCLQRHKDKKGPTFSLKTWDMFEGSSQLEHTVGSAEASEGLYHSPVSLSAQSCSFHSSLTGTDPKSTSNKTPYFSFSRQAFFPGSWPCSESLLPSSVAVIYQNLCFMFGVNWNPCCDIELYCEHVLVSGYPVTLGRILQGGRQVQSRK